MATYYVRTTGNDSTGTGATGAPWLTLSKAMTVAVAGDTVNVGDGTYAENTAAGGAWVIGANLASDLTIQSENGIAANVIIIGASGVNNTLINATTAHLYFKNLTFGMRAGTSYAVRFNAACTSCTFDGCIIDTSASASAIGGIVHISASAVVSGITFLNCTTVVSASGSFVACTHIAPTSTGSFSAAFTGCTLAGHVRLAGSGASATFTTCVISGAIAASALSLVAAGTVSVSGGSVAASNGSAIGANGATSITVSNCLISNTSAHSTAIFGADATSGNATAGSISGCTIIHNPAVAGHVVLVGAGCSNFVVDSCLVSSAYDNACVVKECAGAIVRNCTLIGGTTVAANGALYCKAATGVNAHHNKLISGANYAVRVLKGDTANKSGTVTLIDNQIIVRRGAVVFDWGDSTNDSGGSVCDRNRYGTRTALGGVYGTAAITTLAALKAAWSTYSVPTNDGASRLAARPIVATI